MTTANKISLFRILLVPVFIGFAAYYGQSVAEGAPDQRLRYATIFIFGLAAVSDALDGWLARKFNQKSRLGAILDPLADKLLMLSAVIVLSLTAWPQRFPLWFPLLIISRDLISIVGAFVVHHIAGHCRIQAHWTGKVATIAQIVAILWLMLEMRFIPVIWVASVAAFFTLVSGMINLADGIKQLQASPSSHA